MMSFIFAGRSRRVSSREVHLANCGQLVAAGTFSLKSGGRGCYPAFGTAHLADSPPERLDPGMATGVNPVLLEKYSQRLKRFYAANTSPKAMLSASRAGA